MRSPKLDNVILRHVIEVLIDTNGNVCETARILAVNRNTIYNIMNRSTLKNWRSIEQLKAAVLK